ncbi:hypothetical protein WMY93_024507 [Mugilogobius chulae]|uniref:Guanidinoacetate N-methyltransferase n=1 Tax=Mugilogobius chulae TaxID=88201 RepID=A0AAW0N4C4_9GOBI
MTTAAQPIFSKGEDCKAAWHDASAGYNEADTHLEIMGKPVMERWETPYMHSLATVASSKGGRVLEIGFGMAIAATKVESFPSRTLDHRVQRRRILYDTYPLTEDTWHTHQFDFIKGHAHRLLKSGGVLTYCNLTSWGELLKTNTTTSKRCLRRRRCPICSRPASRRTRSAPAPWTSFPPSECKYYAFHKMITPTILKD